MSNPNPQNQFQPGHPPLSNGRPPKDWTMAALIREAGNEADETGVPRSKIIARKLAELASKGDMQAIKEFNNRLDGMPKQAIELGGEGGGPVKIDINSQLDKIYGNNPS